MSTPTPTVGEVFNVAYPFARSTYSRWDGDEETGPYCTDVPTWAPGVRHADKGEGDVESIADGFGRMVLTVVSTHKPGKYPMRVFFTREWITPDGKQFGKRKCRVTTLGAFKALTQGYRHQFVLAGCACEGCRWPHHDHRYGELLKAEDAEYAAAAHADAPSTPAGEK